jgi:hypothetical protein
MFVKNFINFLAFVGVSHASSSICGFASASPCDLSAAHLCCNNYGTNTCCTFESGFGTSILCEGIADNDECAGYSEFYCNTAEPAFTIYGPGCVHGQYAMPSGSFFLEGTQRVKRDGDCRDPNVGVYYKGGLERKIVIPPGNSSLVAQYLLEDNYSQLDLFEEYGKGSLMSYELLSFAKLLKLVEE